MSAEAKPVEAPAAAPVADVIPPPAEVLPLTEPAAPLAKPVDEVAPIAPVEEKKAEEPVAAAAAATPAEPAKKSEEKPVEPITEGLVTYKAPAKFPKNLVPGREHKYFFYFGDAAVPTEKLSSFTATTKADYTHDAAAWSSQTGKGLLYYAKSAEEKESPAGVLPLSEVTDIKEVGWNELTFKTGEHKHTFLFSSRQERSGWVAALKPEVESATGKKEEVHGSEGFKAALESMKPAVVAAAVLPKGSDGERAPRDEHLAPKDKAKKDRSVSRGKGIFDRFSKKEEAKKEETAAAETAPVAAAATEAPAAETAAPVVPAAEPIEAAPAVAAEPAAAPELAAAPLPLLETPKEEAVKTEEAPKAARRSSKFGDFFKKVTSPTQEKKESEVVPAAEAAEAKTSTEAPVIAAPAAEAEAPAAAAVVDGEAVKSPAAAKPVDIKEKRRSSFFGDLAGSIKKSGKKPEPAKEEAAAVEPAAEPAVAAAPAIAEPVAATEPTAEPVAAAEEPKAAEAAAPKAEETKEEKAKKDKDDLKNRLTGLGRRLSTAIRGNKEKKAPSTPPAVDEAAESKIDSEAPKLEEPKLETAAEEPIVPLVPAGEPEAPKAIGDVVPEAVNIGSAAHTATPAVSATA